MIKAAFIAAFFYAQAFPLWVEQEPSLQPDSVNPSPNLPPSLCSIVQIGWFPLNGLLQNTGSDSRWSFFGVSQPQRGCFFNNERIQDE